MSSDKVTIEDLARMVQNGFDKNVEQHQQIFDRLKRMGNRMEKVENNQNKMMADLENVVHKDKFEKLERRVEKLEELVTSVKKESSK